MGIQIITTVVTSAANYDLASLDSVKAELSISDNASDVILQRYITGASAAISQFCDRVFQAETVKDEFWPDREFYSFQVAGSVPSLALSRWPVGEVSSVTENGCTLVDGADYRADKKAGLLLRLDSLKYPTAWNSWPIVSTYVGGYATIPADIEDAAVRMVKARFLAKGRDPYLKQESIAGVREVSYWIATGNDAGNMPPDVADILDGYRQQVIA